MDINNIINSYFYATPIPTPGARCLKHYVIYSCQYVRIISWSNIYLWFLFNNSNSPFGIWNTYKIPMTITCRARSISDLNTFWVMFLIFGKYLFSDFCSITLFSVSKILEIWHNVEAYKMQTKFDFWLKNTQVLFWGYAHVVPVTMSLDSLRSITEVP